MLNDRDKVSIPNSQVGFIEFVVAPLMVSTVKLFPPLFELTRNIHSNVCYWADMLVYYFRQFKYCLRMNDNVLNKPTAV